MPHNETITQMSYKILCNLNYEIDVVAFKSSVDSSFEKLMKEDPKFNKIHIHYIDVDWKELDVNSHNFNIFKIYKYLKKYNKKSMELFKKNEYISIFSFSVPNYTHIAAYKIKKKYKNKIKWFASFSDPISKNLYIEEFKKGKFKTKILYILLKLTNYKDKYQRLTLKYSDYLIFISDALKKYITNNDKKCINKSIIYPITYVKSWPNYKLLTSKNRKVTNNKIIMSHFGNIYGLRKIDKFLEATLELINNGIIKFDQIEIHQYGEVDKNQMNLICNSKFDNIIFIHDRVNYDKCIELMKNSDILLMFDTIVNDKEIQPFLPSKITDYLLTNKPIFAITLKNSPLYDIINEKHICVDYNVEHIKKGLIKQFKNIKNVNNDIEKYDNNYVSRKVFKNLLDVIDMKEE